MTALESLPFLREPTGVVPMPLLLFEGVEKSGKTYSALALSADPRIGHTAALDLGEGSVDEYRSIGRYHVIEHDGTWRQIFERTTAFLDVDRPEPDRPNLLVIDSATALWDLLCTMADRTARQRAVAKAAKANRQAPAADAEVQITMDVWNQVKSLWRKLMTRLMTWDGIVILTARGGWVAKVEGGRPVEGQKVWSIQAEKSLPFDATCIVRFAGPGDVAVTGVRSLRLQLGAEPRRIPDFTAAKLLDMLGVFDPTTVRGARQMVAPAPRTEDLPDDADQLFTPPPAPGPTSPARDDLRAERAQLTAEQVAALRTFCAESGIPLAPAAMSEEQVEAVLTFIRSLRAVGIGAS